MDHTALEERPWRRARLAENFSSQQQAHHAAPARPLTTPQQQPQQPHFGTPPAADSLQAPSTVSRWLACSFKAGLLGVAAYDRLSNELSVLQTSEESKGPGAFQMLQYIKLQVNPEVIILSAAAEPALLDAVKLPPAAAGVGGGDDSAEPVVQLQRPSLFTNSKALQMVNAIQVRGHQQHQPQQAARVWHSRGPAGPAADLVDMSAQQQVAALGALVAVLLQLQEEEGSAEGSCTLLVDRLYELTLNGHLVVDGPSLAALDIFKEEQHPSAMGIGSSKEGVSVYGLLQRCVTGMGRRLLRQWFLRPVVQLDVIADRHDTLELLVAAHTTNDALRTGMRKLQDLPRLLCRLRVSQARPQLSTFKQLHDSIRHLLALHETIAALAPRAAATAARDGAAAGMAAEAAGAAPPRPHAAYTTPADADVAQQQGRQPGWLFDDADAAEAAASGFFQQAHDTHSNPPGGPSAGHRGGLYSTPANSAGRQGAQEALPPGGAWDGLRITHKLLKHIGPELSSCCCMIADVLDLNCSLEGCMVQPSVCDPLDELRATLDQLPALLTEAIEQELMRVPPNVARRNSKQLWSVVYIPQVGFVISISGGRLSEELAEMLPDYTLAFMGEDGPAGGLSGAEAAAAAAEGGSGLDLDRSCAYYTCEVTKQLNAHYGDLQHKIQDLEASICTELIKRLLQFGPALTAASTAVAELDCLCSLAAAARELNYCRPHLVADSVIHIEGGRHPLCELLAADTFIDNDTTLGSLGSSTAEVLAATPAVVGAGADTHNSRQHNSAAGPRLLLITGPNASGKSVYMKQVALLVYMAHIGSFVPCRSAVIGLTDRILTRLPGMESVAQHTSSFMADLAQVSNLLAQATSRSLILLDEFGKGTLTADGVGLLSALLQHYMASPEPPLLLACTHFSELLDQGVLPRSPQLGLCTMQVLVGDAGADRQEEQHGQVAAQHGAEQLQQGEHVFLYKLVPGAVASSYGLHCARLCGVDGAVLTRAADVLALQEAGQPISRLQVPQLEERDTACWQLVQQLAALDMSSEEAVTQLLTSVVQVEAGVAN